MIRYIQIRANLENGSASEFRESPNVGSAGVRVIIHGPGTTFEGYGSIEKDIDRTNVLFDPLIEGRLEG